MFSWWVTLCKVSDTLRQPILMAFWYTVKTLENSSSIWKKKIWQVTTKWLENEMKKCSFLQSKAHYLGFIINDRRISSDPLKVEVILSLPTPNCVRKVRSFIGMCWYIRSSVGAKAWVIQKPNKIITVKNLDTVDSSYLEFQGTLWNTSRYPYLDISVLRKWGKNKSNNHI